MSSFPHFRRIARLLNASCAALCLTHTAAAFDVEFEDVATAAGLHYTGASFGSSWGDFDADGHPDLYLSNHYKAIALYRNTGTGQFDDVTSMLAVPLDPTADTHGGAWADFDNDGDRDLLFLVGAQTGRGENRLLVNHGDHFTEEAVQRGLALPLGRGRTPLWLDWNGDGRLDALLANWTSSDAPTALLTQTDSGFVDSVATTGLQVNAGSLGAQLLPLDAGPLRLLIHSRSGFPDGIYATTVTPFGDESPALGIAPQSLVDDVVIGDFDNDLESELFLARRTRPSAAVQTGEREIRASLDGAAGQTLGLDFSGGAQLDVRAGTQARINKEAIFIGAAGTNPAALNFAVNSADPAAWGRYDLPDGDDGMLVYFEPATARWHFDVIGAKSPRLVITGSTDLADLQTEGFDHADGARPPVLLDRTPGGFVDAAADVGVAVARPCAAAVAADFDNDMDLDLYLVCNDAAHNLPNVLLENLGDGQFIEVPDAAGAAGAGGGRGDTATTADFDSDGFIDLLVTNGRGDVPLYEDGPTELLRNGGNGNAWLQLELVGTESNADGIGALVYVDSGGRRQVRARDGGMHRFSQNHARLHFGLGTNQRVDAVEIHWPGGIVQTLSDLRANQVLTVVETAPGADADADGIADTTDNCPLVANSQQVDSDTDGIGNVCDPDIALPNDCLVNFLDLDVFAAAFFSDAASAGWNADADFDDDGAVNFADLQTVADYFLLAPGPGGPSNLCE